MQVTTSQENKYEQEQVCSCQVRSASPVSFKIITKLVLQQPKITESLDLHQLFSIDVHTRSLSTTHHSDVTPFAFVGIPAKYSVPSLLSGSFEIWAFGSWMLNLLTNRLQTFGIRGRRGGPQGCLLSLLLFTLHTHSCSSVHEEDSTVESNNSKNLYPKEISCVTEWCCTHAAHHQQHQAN